VRDCPDEGFLGQREKVTDAETGHEVLGDFKFMTYAEVDEKVTNLAKGIMSENLCPELEAEGKMWRFAGVWAKNRWEWSAVELAGMHFKGTTVGFFDQMSHDQVMYILNQTEMSTVFVSSAYLDRMTEIKSGHDLQGRNRFLKNVVVFDEFSEDQQSKA
jgi:long-chain acyl-CoA synthetase